jgi:molybdenum cofactor cytidylyltransferase
MRKVGALILAAGGSTRLGEPKQFLVFQGETLLRRIARTAHSAGCAPVVVVAGDLVEQTRTELRDLPVRLIKNDAWRSGIGSSIKVGVTEIRETVSAILILVCDQPFVSNETIRNICHKSSLLVASGYADTVGTPALFDVRYFDELATLPNHAGAKLVIEAHTADVSVVPFPGGVTDIDTRADYDALTV